MGVAQSADERVTLRFVNTYWDPPPPEQYCGWGTKLTWGLGGAGVAGVTGTLARAFSGG